MTVHILVHLYITENGPQKLDASMCIFYFCITMGAQTCAFACMVLGYPLCATIIVYIQ